MPQKYLVKRIWPDLIVCLFVLNLTLSAGAATLVWSGGGADDLASNPFNWAGGILPQGGSDVVFDGTSSKNCTWDLNITVSSFNINPGYTGNVTIDAGLTIENAFIWAGGGVNNLASNPANWSGGAAPKDGDAIHFDGMKDCLWDMDISPSSFRMGPGYTGTVSLSTEISIAGDLFIEGGFLNLNDEALEAEGNLFIGLNGTLYAASSIVRVKGNWINKGAFISGTSTVILNGTNQTVYGNSVFYNLVKASYSDDTLYFETGRTQTILNNLTLQGTAESLLLLRGTEGETFWAIDPGGTRYISHADIKNMRNVNKIGLVTDNSINSGNNSNVYVDIDQCM